MSFSLPSKLLRWFYWCNAYEKAAERRFKTRFGKVRMCWLVDFAATTVFFAFQFTFNIYLAFPLFDLYKQKQKRFFFVQIFLSKSQLGNTKKEELSYIFHNWYCKKTGPWTCLHFETCNELISFNQPLKQIGVLFNLYSTISNCTQAKRGKQVFFLSTCFHRLASNLSHWEEILLWITCSVVNVTLMLWERRGGGVS